MQNKELGTQTQEAAERVPALDLRHVDNKRTFHVTFTMQI